MRVAGFVQERLGEGVVGLVVVVRDAGECGPDTRAGMGGERAHDVFEIVPRVGRVVVFDQCIGVTSAPSASA